MTSSISGAMGGMGAMPMHRPDPSRMADKLFSRLDTKNQGYIEKSDLQSALSQVSGSSDDSGADEIFSRLDGDSDGKITKDEMSSGLKKLAEELDSQFNSMRMQGFGGPGQMGGMPPPPPPPGDDQGFSKDELNSQLEEMGSTDSKRSSLVSDIVNNFEAADADGNGKVTAQEAHAYAEASRDSASGSSDGSTTSSSSARESSEAQVMRKIMELMHAYGGPAGDASQPALSGLLSVSA